MDSELQLGRPRFLRGVEITALPLHADTPIRPRRPEPAFAVLVLVCLYRSSPFDFSTDFPLFLKQRRTGPLDHTGGEQQKPAATCESAMEARPGGTNLVEPRAQAAALPHGGVAMQPWWTSGGGGLGAVSPAVVAPGISFASSGRAAKAAAGDDAARGESSEESRRSGESKGSSSFLKSFSGTCIKGDELCSPLVVGGSSSSVLVPLLFINAFFSLYYDVTAAYPSWFRFTQDSVSIFS